MLSPILQLLVSKVLRGLNNLSWWVSCVAYYRLFFFVPLFAAFKLTSNPASIRLPHGSRKDKRVSWDSTRRDLGSQWRIAIPPPRFWRFVDSGSNGFYIHFFFSFLSFFTECQMKFVNVFLCLICGDIAAQMKFVSLLRTAILQIVNKRRKCPHELCWLILDVSVFTIVFDSRAWMRTVGAMSWNHFLKRTLGSAIGRLWFIWKCGAVVSSFLDE